MMDYLAEANVPLVGGSWIAKSTFVAAEQWETITARARDVADRLAKESKGE